MNIYELLTQLEQTIDSYEDDFELSDAIETIIGKGHEIILPDNASKMVNLQIYIRIDVVSEVTISIDDGGYKSATLDGIPVLQTYNSLAFVLMAIRAEGSEKLKQYW